MFYNCSQFRYESCQALIKIGALAQAAYASLASSAVQANEKKKIPFRKHCLIRIHMFPLPITNIDNHRSMKHGNHCLSKISVFFSAVLSGPQRIASIC